MNKIEDQVMAGVAAVYVARKLVSKTALECYALFLSSFSLTLLVSLPSVGHNFLVVERSGLPAVFAYFLSAILNTRHIVQAIVLVGAVALMLILLDALRSLTSSQQTRMA